MPVASSSVRQLRKPEGEFIEQNLPDFLTWFPQIQQLRKPEGELIEQNSPDFLKFAS